MDESRMMMRPGEARQPSDVVPEMARHAEQQQERWNARKIEEKG